MAQQVIPLKIDAALSGTDVFSAFFPTDFFIGCTRGGIIEIAACVLFIEKAMKVMKE